MSQASRWWDRNVSHETERREAKTRADKQIAEFEKAKAEVKAEHDRLDAEKKYEQERRDKKTARRSRTASARRGFLSGPDSELQKNLG